VRSKLEEARDQVKIIDEKKFLEIIGSGVFYLVTII
jgi:hypothetical protein